MPKRRWTKKYLSLHASVGELLRPHFLADHERSGKGAEVRQSKARIEGHCFATRGIKMTSSVMIL